MDNSASSILDDFRLDGRVAVVTGAGRGIGAAIATALADVGADVALVARTETDLNAVAENVRARGRRAVVLPADVNDVSVLPGIIDATVRDLGGLDVVVNNAGGSPSYPFLDTRPEHLERAFHFNVTVAFELSRLAVPHMLGRDGGSILNISSVAGSRVTRGGLAYATAKAALSHLTRMMAADLAPRIRVNAVLPGAVETDALRGFLDGRGGDIREQMIERTPMRRNGAPRDIAAAAVYLVSPAAAWVTGKLVEVDGGASAEVVPKTLPDL